jgi:hypothetical protein
MISLPERYKKTLSGGFLPEPYVTGFTTVFLQIEF